MGNSWFAFESFIKKPLLKILCYGYPRIAYYLLNIDCKNLEGFIVFCPKKCNYFIVFMKNKILNGEEIINHITQHFAIPEQYYPEREKFCFCLIAFHID